MSRMCNMCGKRFKKKRHLKEHVALHMGERPYKCSSCEKAFFKKKKLKKHSQVKHSRGEPGISFIYLKNITREDSVTKKAKLSSEAEPPKGESLQMQSVKETKTVGTAKTDMDHLGGKPENSLSVEKNIKKDMSSAEEVPERSEAEPPKRIFFRNVWESVFGIRVDKSSDGLSLGKKTSISTANEKNNVTRDTHTKQGLDGGRNGSEQADISSDAVCSDGDPEISIVYENCVTKGASATNQVLTHMKADPLKQPDSDSSSEKSSNGCSETQQENISRTEGVNKFPDDISHSVRLPYSCNICCKRFVLAKLLIKHVACHDGNTDKQYVCILCKRKFLKVSYLAIHLEVHVKNIDTCPVCGKNYFVKKNLKRHLLLHSVTLSHTSEAYKKRLAKVGGPGEHVSENPHKPYSGEFEKVSVNRTSSDIDHFQHTTEQPRQEKLYCETFAKKSILTQHFSDHTSKKRYGCVFCEKWFATQTSLGKHLQVHRGNRIFICSVCNRGFRNSRELTSHLQTHTL